jgi:hypothetical protein
MEPAILVTEIPLKYETHLMAWSQDGTHLAVEGYEGIVKIWNVPQGQMLKTLQVSSGAIYDLAWINNDTQLMTGGVENVLRVHNIITGQLDRFHDFGTPEEIGVTDYINWIQITPQENTQPMMVLGKDDGIHLLQVNTFAHIRQLPSPMGQFNYGDWNPDGTKLVTVNGQAHDASIWDTVSGQLIHVLSGHGATVVSASWSSDGTYIATGSHDNSIRIWYAATGTQVGLITPNDPTSKAILDVDWSVTGRLAYATLNEIADPNNPILPLAVQVITDVSSHITVIPPTPTATNTPTPTETPTPTPNPNPPPCRDDEATRSQCSQIVYYVYYHNFVALYGRPPNLRDFIATIYVNEFVRAGHGDLQIFREALANSFWGVMKNIFLSCALDAEACRAEFQTLTPDTLIKYVGDNGVQSWYGKANNGNPTDEGNNRITLLYAEGMPDYTAVGKYILTSNSFGCGTGRPCSWGNYGYGSRIDRDDLSSALSYSLVNDDNTDILYCITSRQYKDENNDDIANHPPDTWREDRFVILPGALGDTSTYSYAFGDPPWLDDVILTQDGSTPARLVLDQLPPNCPYPYP